MRERRTRIVATVGPACRHAGCIHVMIEAGVDVFRLNFSHGTVSQHRENVKTIREQAGRSGRPVAIMQDLQGPRIRTGRLADPAGVALTEGHRIAIAHGDFRGDENRIATTYSKLAEDVKAGDKILLNDGMIELKVLERDQDNVACEVVSGGLLREHQGMNLPGTELSISAPTDKDLSDVEFGLCNEVDYIALSFVRSALDVLRLKERIAECNCSAPVPVIAKIERPEALDQIESILEVSDGVMVARGDLGIEMPVESVPAAQKGIIRTANRRGVPVITATQMLESMVENRLPTRAEATDVANAILDGTDAVMLSAETAIGRHPVAAVRMMDSIAREIEGMITPGLVPAPSDGAIVPKRQHALAEAACRIAKEIGACGIAAFTMTGSTARFVSQQRPAVPIFALTPNAATLRRLALLWGVVPVQLPVFASTDEMIERGEQRLIELGFAHTGETILCVAGVSTGTAGGTDMLKIHYVDGKNPYLRKE